MGVWGLVREEMSTGLVGMGNGRWGTEAGMGAAGSRVRKQHQVHQGLSWFVRGWLVWHVVLQPRLLLWLLC